MSKKKKFSKIWNSQTDLGKNFGLSAIAVGRLLIKAGLKDASTKAATQIALKSGYAMSTPLKDGTPYFMWNVKKVRPLIAQDHAPLSKVDFWVNEVKDILRESDKLLDEGHDKLGYMLQDMAFDDVPGDVRAEVKSKMEASRE